MIHVRAAPACTIFYSPAHDGRSVVIVAGGLDNGYTLDTAEIWDYTTEGSKWEESKIIFTIPLVILNYKL